MRVAGWAACMIGHVLTRHQAGQRPAQLWNGEVGTASRSITLTSHHMLFILDAHIDRKANLGSISLAPLERLPLHGHFAQPQTA